MPYTGGSNRDTYVQPGVPPVTNPTRTSSSDWFPSGNGSGSGGNSGSGNGISASDSQLLELFRSIVGPVGDVTQFVSMLDAFKNIDSNQWALLRSYNPSLADSLSQTGLISGVSPNVSTAVNVNSDNSAGLMALGAQIANAAIANQNSVNGLNERMWREGEALTDERIRNEMQFTADQAKYAMDRQEYWSNTAHQREVADLKAAGLNPVLSANGQGASTPSGLMGGATAASANGFSAQQANIVGAYSAAGSFVSSMMQLKESMRQFDKRFTGDMISSLLGSILGFGSNLLKGSPTSYKNTFSTSYINSYH